MAATIGTGIDDHGNHYLTLDGPIVPGDPERFAAEIFAANARGYRLDALRLNSPGGAVWEAMAIAVMVRWVENMATVVQKDAKCESACFGLFAAGWRKYVDPVSDEITQIGVHSLYQLIEQEGTSTSFLKEMGDATIEAVRLLKKLEVPDSIIGKIVTTPSKEMTYLTTEDLESMGVKIAGSPEKASPQPVPESESLGGFFKFLAMDKQLQKGATVLTPAVLESSVRLKNGIDIPTGTVLIVQDNVTWADLQQLHFCFSSTFQPLIKALRSRFVTTHLCKVSYHPAGQEIGVAQIPNSSLTLIRQGFQDWVSPRQPAQQPPPPAEQPQVAPQTRIRQGFRLFAPAPAPQTLAPSEEPQVAPQTRPPSTAEPQPPKKLWAKEYAGMATTDLMFRRAPDPNADPIQPEPIPKGTEVSLYADCEVWRGSGRGEQDADNIWCPVIYGNQKGWANGLYLQMRNGRRMACVMYPTAYRCPETEASVAR
jgi:hypothetical protein